MSSRLAAAMATDAAVQEEMALGTAIGVEIEAQLDAGMILTTPLKQRALKAFKERQVAVPGASRNSIVPMPNSLDLASVSSDDEFDLPSELAAPLPSAGAKFHVVGGGEGAKVKARWHMLKAAQFKHRSSAFKEGPRLPSQWTQEDVVNAWLGPDRDWGQELTRSNSQQQLDETVIHDYKEGSAFTHDYAMAILKPYIEADMLRIEALQRASHPDSKIPILFMWQSSAWQFMFQDFFFWVTCSIFLAASILKTCLLEIDINKSFELGRPQLFNLSMQSSPELKEQWGNLFPPYLMTALSFVFFSFFSHFATKQEQKFEANYEQCCTAAGRCFNVAVLIQGAMSNPVLKMNGVSDNNKEHARRLAARLLRFMQVCFLQGIVGLTPRCADDKPSRLCAKLCGCCGNVLLHGAYDSSWLISMCIKHNLLETLELHSIIERFDLDTGGTAYRHMLAQCQTLLMQMQNKGFIDSRTFELASIEVNSLRGCLGTLSDLQALSTQPMFVNGLVTFTILFLTMNAIDLGMTYSPVFDTSNAPDMNLDSPSDIIALLRCFFAFLGLVFFCLGIFGQLTAAFHMADPWGNDNCDLFVTAITEDTILGAKRLFNWDCHMTLHEQETTTSDGYTKLRQVAPLVAQAHDDLRDDELMDTAEGFDRCGRRYMLPRPVLQQNYPEHEVLLDFDELTGAMCGSTLKSPTATAPGHLATSDLPTLVTLYGKGLLTDDEFRRLKPA